MGTMKRWHWRTWTPEQIQEMRADRYVRGMLLREIAQKWELSITSVRKKTNLGANIKSHHMKIIAMSIDGYSTREIAQEIGITIYGVNKVKQKYAHMIENLGEQE